MAIRLNTVQISFCANQTAKEKKKEAEKKAVTGGGAVAAATAATRNKAVKSAFDMFDSSKKLTQGMKTVTNSAKTATETLKQSTTLWGKVCENARWAKDAIVKWGSKFKNVKYIKPLVESKPFMMFAGALGYGFGLVTLISGCSDIVKVATDAVQN